MEGIFTIFLALSSIVTSVNHPNTTTSAVTLAPITVSVAISELTTQEEAVVRDPNFRHLIRSLAGIEDNYRRAGKLDTKKMMSGALKGVLEYGTGDKYSKFISTEEMEDYAKKTFDGEKLDDYGFPIDETLVTWRPLKGKIAYINISGFRSVLIGQFDAVVTQLVVMKPKGMIIDLRGNPGGMTNVLFDVMEYLVKPHSLLGIFKEYKRMDENMRPFRASLYRGMRMQYVVDDFEFLREVPIVILINGKTASASEIMTTALSEMGRAKTVGTKSFGKGIFQAHLSSFFGMSKVTTGEWFTPKRKSIHGKGIEPDFKVKDTRGKKSYDAQLQKAIKVLRQEIKKK